MACKKYTITNTGSTATIYFEYRRCGDGLQMDQVPLLYNQTKNIWFLDGTWEIDQNSALLCDIVDDGAFPVTPSVTPSQTSILDPTPTPTNTPTLTKTPTQTPTATQTIPCFCYTANNTTGSAEYFTYTDCVTQILISFNLSAGGTISRCSSTVPVANPGVIVIGGTEPCYNLSDCF